MPAKLVINSKMCYKYFFLNCIFSVKVLFPFPHFTVPSTHLCNPLCSLLICGLKNTCVVLLSTTEHFIFRKRIVRLMISFWYLFYLKIHNPPYPMLKAANHSNSSKIAKQMELAAEKQTNQSQHKTIIRLQHLILKDVLYICSWTLKRKMP